MRSRELQTRQPIVARDGSLIRAPLRIALRVYSSFRNDTFSFNSAPVAWS